MFQQPMPSQKQVTQKSLKIYSRQAPEKPQ